MLATFQWSCTDDGKDEFLDEFDTILYFRNSGELPLTFYETGDNAVYELTVNKAGSNYGATAFVDLRTMTDEEVEAYNAKWGTEYKALPQSCFGYDVNHLDFSTADTYKQVRVSLIVEEIRKLQEANEGDTYVVPLQLCNGSDSINSDKQYAFLLPTVEVPTIGFEVGGFLDRSLADNGINEEEVSINLTLPLADAWNLQCDLEVDKEALELYNQENGTNYALLPAEAYQMDTQVIFENGQTTAPFIIKVNKTALDYGTYILPLTLTRVSKEQFRLDAERQTVLLGISFIPPSVSLSADMLSTNALEPYEGSLAALLDGDIETYFHSAWSWEVGEDHYVQVSLNAPLQNFVFSYTNRSSNGNGAMTEFYVSVSEDGEHFEEVARFTAMADGLPTGGAESWTSPTIRCEKGYSYIRFTNVINASGGKYFVWSEFSLSGK